MPLIKPAFLAASFAIFGMASVTSAQAYDSSRIEAMRSYEWSMRNTMSVEARRARAQVVPPVRQPAPFGRAALESQTW